MGPSSLFFQPSSVSCQALVTTFGVCFFALVSYKLLEDGDPAGLVLQGPAPDSRGINKDLLYERHIDTICLLKTVVSAKHITLLGHLWEAKSLRSLFTSVVAEMYYLLLEKLIF